MKNGVKIFPVLFPSQTQAKDALNTCLDRGQMAYLQGLSGTGKSFIAQQALSEREGLIVESRGVRDRVVEIRNAVECKVRVVILAQPGTNTADMAENIGVPSQTVKVRGLSAVEIGAWLDGVHPACSPEEREYIFRYSLGVPLLIERLCVQRPVTRASALTQCVVYLQDLIEECHLGGKDRDDRLRQILGEYTNVPVPDDVLLRLADCESRRHRGTPMSTLHSRLLPGSELPTPATLQIFDLYEEWLHDHPDEPSFDVFVRQVPDAEAFLEDIGYRSHPDPAATLKRFIFADARKGATFYGRSGRPFSRVMDNSTSDSDSHIYPVILKLARASGTNATLGTKEVFGRETCVLNVDDSQDSLFLHKHDHTPWDVMPVAYTVECALQQLGASYIVQYNRKTFRYDPHKKSYEPLEAADVDFFRELYGPEDGDE